MSNTASPERAMNNTEHIYKWLSEWCNMNRITINVNKTKHTLINCKKKVI